MHHHIKTGLSVLLTCTLGVGVGLIAALGLPLLQANYIEGDYSVQRAQTQRSVILLGTSWCDYCRQARSHLQAQGVAFADLDIETSRQALAWHRELKAQGVPVILIGDRQLSGFDPSEIDEAIMALAPGTQEGDSR